VLGGPQGGFDATVNKGEVYLQFLQPTGMDFTANNNGDKSGGFVTPNMSLVGLGPIGGKAELAFLPQRAEFENMARE